uniref:Uncharacterized protein n=1 Tax=Arundo donax TaxID=35708 RepID=A0A0A9B2K7_ARUDO
MTRQNKTTGPRTSYSAFS